MRGPQSGTVGIPLKLILVIFYLVENTVILVKQPKVCYLVFINNRSGEKY